MVSLLYLGGVQLISLGILAETVRRILTQTEQRRLYVVRDAIGFDKDLKSLRRNRFLHGLEAEALS
jgi:hypothetical protein